jgi:hypothetical protein
MPRVASYSIIMDRADGGGPDNLTFEVPSNIDPGSRSVLGFMLEVYHVEPLNLTLEINGVQV